MRRHRGCGVPVDRSWRWSCRRSRAWPLVVAPGSPPDAAPPSWRSRPQAVDLATRRPEAACWTGRPPIVHLGAVDGPVPTARRRRRRRAPRALAPPGRRSVRTRRAALERPVYGAWANNPVPLTEDAPLRPNPGVGDRVRQGGGRASGAPTGRDEHPGATVPLLRPTAPCRPERRRLAGPCARPRSALVPVARRAPPVQFLARRRPRRRGRPGPPGPARRPVQRRPRRVARPASQARP